MTGSPNPDLTAPFLKWAGGKRQLLPKILSLMPDEIDTYYEPFVGGGAVFFALSSAGLLRHAVIGDVNAELVNLYAQVQRDPSSLMRYLDLMPVSESQFYALRALKPEDLSPTSRAARILYLNKTAFNGLYRVNKHGQFNTPWGKYENPALYDAGRIAACSRALEGASILGGDFASSTNAAGVGDAVYFDPPYVAVSKTANFTGYANGGFSMDDQERLAKLFTSLVERDVFTLASNADLPVVREMYAGWEIHEVSARRAINSKGDKRGKVGELLIVGRRS